MTKGTKDAASAVPPQVVGDAREIYKAHRHATGVGHFSCGKRSQENNGHPTLKPHQVTTPGGEG